MWRAPGPRRRVRAGRNLTSLKTVARGCLSWRGHPADERRHEPILTGILAKPVGWLAIGGSIFMVGILVVFCVRKQVLKEERDGQ